MLSKHAELLQNGAVSLSNDDHMPPLEFLKQGFSLGAMKNTHALIAHKENPLQARGMS